MPVVATVELQYHPPASGGSRQPDNAHDRFGAGAHEADHVESGEAGDHSFSELDLQLGRSAEGGTVAGCLDQRGEHMGVRVTKDQRSPGEYQVYVLVAVSVDQAGALTPGHESRDAAHALERPNRAVDSSGEHSLRCREQALRRCGCPRSYPGIGHAAPPDLSHTAASFA